MSPGSRVVQADLGYWSIYEKYLGTMAKSSLNVGGVRANTAFWVPGARRRFESTTRTSTCDEIVGDQDARAGLVYIYTPSPATALQQVGQGVQKGRWMPGGYLDMV